MTEYIQKKCVRMRFLTPVHISDGYEGELIPTEYVITSSGMLHKIDLGKLIGLLPENSFDNLNVYIENEDLIGIKNFIKLLWQEREDLFSDCIEYLMHAGDLEAYYSNMQNESQASQLIVTPFIRTGKRTFLPGSSVKGAIRTAFINELLKPSIEFSLLDGGIDNKAKKLEAYTLKYSDKDPKKRREINLEKDPFKALKISDAAIPVGNSTVRKIEIVKKDKSGKFDITQMKETKIFGEFIDKGMELDLEARLDSRYFGSPRSIGMEVSFDKIINSSKAFYKRVLTHEKDAFFSDFDKQVGKSKISQLYDDLLKLNDSQDTFVLRIGRHIGRNSISFNLINKKGIEPKSRNLIIENGEYWPVGWICATVI